MYQLCMLLLAGVLVTSSVNAKSLRIYLDADLSNHQQSARSIEQGIRTALNEVDSHLQGYELELVILDHRGSVLRSKQNYQKFLRDSSEYSKFEAKRVSA